MQTFDSHSPLVTAPAAPVDASAMSAPARQRVRTGERTRRPRIEAIDAARGCAMVLVCVSHIKHHFVETAPEIHWLLTIATRVATPTFLLLSGFVIGHVLRSNSRGNVGVALVDRGLFLILVAHLLMGLPELAQHTTAAGWLFGRLEITDVIGFALFVAVWTRAIHWKAAMALGISLCLASWPIANLLNAESEPARVLASVLFHSPSIHNGDIDAPLVAYVGVFLIGMALSGRFAAELRLQATARIARPLFAIGAASVAVVAFGILVWYSSRAWLADASRYPQLAELLLGLFDPRIKWPPSPAYLLFYGGAGLLLTSLFLYGRPAWLITPTVRAASVIGRASLMCFVIQDWLFFGVPVLFGFDDLTSGAFWFAYFAASVLLLYGLARKWDDADANRFLTVGLKQMYRRDLRHA